MLSQLTRAECLLIAGDRLRHKYGDAIPRLELQAEAAQLGGYEESSIIPSDHCYEMINQDRSSFVSPLFVRQGQGTYKYLGSVYPYSGPIYWKPKGQPPRQVGHWENGMYSLSFDPRTHGKLAASMEIDIRAIKDRLFSNEPVRSRIARDFGLADIQTDAEEFAEDVLNKLEQRPSPNPLDQNFSNAEVFRAAVRALGSNQRKWADYLGNESRIAEELFGFDPDETSKCARIENIARWLPGQSSNADSRAIMCWARLLSSGSNYYQSIKHLGAAFRSLSLSDYNEPLTDTELLLCIVGYLGKPPRRWAGAIYLDSVARELPYDYWKTRGMGYVLASEFLRNLGWNGFKPDRHIARLFSRWLPEQGPVVLGRVHRLESLIGCTAKPLENYLRYSLVGNSVAPKGLPLSQVDNLVWLLGAYVERKGLESADRYLTSKAIAA